MYRKISWICALFITLFAILLYVLHFEWASIDEKLYVTLMQEGNEHRTNQKWGVHPIHQVRREVRKDLWQGGNVRAHSRLMSDSSQLFLTRKKGKFEAVEQLEEFVCALQEEVSSETDRQKVRWLKGVTGTYSFPSHQLLAQETTFSFYDLPGTTLPLVPPDTEPLMRGEAHEISLVASEPLTAYHLAGVTAQGVEFEADEMMWHRGHNEAYFRGNVHINYQNETRARGDEGVLVYRGDPTLDFYFLNGNVQLQSHRFEGKECWALSDTLKYRPDTGVAILTCNPPDQVLVWQNESRLSAPEVHIHYDPRTKTESVQGVGHVHFTVDWEKTP